MVPTLEDSTTLQKPRHRTREQGDDMWGHLAPLSIHLARHGPTYQLALYVGLPPPLRMHLGHCLSRFNPWVHVGPSGLYNLAPASPPRHNLSHQVI